MEFDLPESVKVINPTAFTNCFGLKAVVIPETVQLVEYDTHLERLSDGF